MALFNVSLLQGRIADAPRLRRIASGASVCDFNLHMTKPVRVGEGQWEEKDLGIVPCEAWFGIAERVAAEVAAGQAVIIVGHVRIHNGALRCLTVEDIGISLGDRERHHG